MGANLPIDPIRAGNEGVDSGRRSLVGLMAASPLLLLGLASSPAGAQTGACLDLAKLPMGERSLRNSLGFKMQAADPAMRCGTCTFYTPGEGECGKCQIFNNGPTTANSVCNSWAKKG